MADYQIRNIDSKLYGAFKSRCAAQGLTLREVFQALIELWISGRIDIEVKQYQRIVQARKL